jgi:outer membrane chaperone skp
MKKNLLRLSCLAMAGALLLGTASCGGDDSKKDPRPAAAAAKSGTSLPNYRYVDLDTILSKYNLAKDYNEEMLRKQSELEGEMRRHENTIASAANTMQKKMQNNGYLSEDAFRADQQRLENMRNNAQNKVGAMQQTLATEAEAAQKTLNDSIEAFIKDYNLKHGYDAILFKAATLYINPALDITDEVVEGLNARYNKIKK